MPHHQPLELAAVTWATAESATPEEQVLALVLITAWAVRTGRVLRPVPMGELSPEELVDFWADDQLEQPMGTPADDGPAP